MLRFAGCDRGRMARAAELVAQTRELREEKFAAVCTGLGLLDELHGGADPVDGQQGVLADGFGAPRCLGGGVFTDVVHSHLDLSDQVGYYTMVSTFDRSRIDY